MARGGHHQNAVASGTLGNGARNVMQSAGWMEVKNELVETKARIQAYLRR